MNPEPEVRQAEYPNQPVKVLYIMGSGRSGSTVLDMALGSVPTIVSAGELANLHFRTNLELEYCSCGRVIASCPFWSQVMARLESQSDFSNQRYALLQQRYERLRSLPRLISAHIEEDADFRWYLQRSAIIFRTIADIAGARVVVDSSKSPTRALALSRVPGIKLVPVHLVADPCGVVWSLRRAWAVDPTAGIQHTLKPVSTARAAAGWLATNWAAEYVKRRLPGALFLRYEDFAAAPTAVVERILHAAAIDYPAGGLPEIIEPGKLHVAAGNRVRRQDKVVIRMDDAWMRKMPTGKKRLVRLIDFPLMAKYGYPYTVKSATRRVTLVIYSLERGGAERIMTELANHWVEDDHDVQLITFAPDAESSYILNPKVQRAYLQIAGISRNALHGTLRNVAALRKLRRALRAQRPDVVLSFMTRANVLTLLAGWGLNCRKIISERVDPRFDAVPPAWRLLRRISYGLADRIVVQTEAVRAWCGDVSAARRCEVIPNPLSQSFDGEPLPTGNVRSKLGLPEGAKILIGMGRLKPQKGFDLLIRAFSNCHVRYPQWHLVIVGEGQERDRLLEFARDCGVVAQVHFPGLSQSPRQWLQQADLFVLSSRYEGFPNVLLEAMACGLPVVSFACPSGPNEIIRDGEDGILVKNGDIRELTRTLDALMGDDARRAELSENARRNVQRYSPAAVLSLWDKLLEEVE